MFDGLSFDELNKLVKNERSEPYEQYFGVMSISKKQKENRVSLSEELENVFLLVLILLFTMQQYGTINWETARKRLEDGYQEAVKKHMQIDDYLRLYIMSFSYDVIDSTRNHEKDPYYYSRDRGMYLAENEANTSWNYREFGEAVTAGKTKKKWIDMRDARERETHWQVGGTVKKITEPFLVGDSIMDFPKDMKYSPNPNQVINCRCSIQYF